MVIDKVIGFINDHDGFTVVGWYKRGEINDSSNEESNNQVESSEIAFHIISIMPKNKRLFEDHPTLVGMKFDSSE